MAPLGDRAFEAWVEGISGEEGENVRLSGESGIGTIMIDYGLESRNTTDWLRRPWFHVVNIIVMDETKIGGSGSFGRMGDGESVGFHSGHSV